ncbi:DUF899 domain-containing protein [Actinokineospora sp. UTMC 2448]|uniref:DUF899 domain-containing protein n=1 Tax=Actinokineospora sp. UTMC 2448 TaxID=2268449 RepID=UPI00216494E3|nr:DUF899 domain-containing protein [Actinokineospora sp. UTMC 2448]
MASREEWLVARMELLAAEKEATKARDALNARRRDLPMVEVDKEYVFDSPGGKISLAELFDGRRQLLVYHFMFDPEWEAGCVACSFLADNLPHLSHLRSRETNLVVVSRAPLERITKFKERMEWTFPWVSSYGSDFNYDFHATQDESVAPVFYNYRDKTELEATTPWHAQGEQHGMSVFFRDGERIFHTYSSYGRGPDLLLTTYNLLDLTPLGRQEVGTGIANFKHHDQY